MRGVSLAKHVIDQASGTLNVIAPPMNHHFITGFHLKQWTVKRVKKYALSSSPPLTSFQVDKSLCFLEQVLELCVQVAVHHGSPQLVLHFGIHGLELRLVLELLRHEHFRLAKTSA